MPFATFYLESTDSIDLVKQNLHDGHDLDPIYDSNGNYMKDYPPRFFQQAIVNEDKSLIKLYDVPESLALGRIAMVYPYDKKEIIATLDEMGLSPNADTNEALQYFITENVESFLENYKNNIYVKGTVSECEIREDDKIIIFYSPEGKIMVPHNDTMIIGSTIYTFNKSDRYELYFKPS